ncbi:Lhr family helicase, partial [Streptomyces sudanensis]
PTPLHESVLAALSGGYGLFFRQIADQVRATAHPGVTDPQLADALWDLAWSGRLTNDALAPLRAVLGSGRTAGSTAHRARRSVPRGRYGTPSVAARPASRSGPPTVSGRWSLLPTAEPDPTHRAHALARTLLDRHGVVTRGAVAAEGVEGGFSAVYRVLSAFEDSGQARRGYVVEGLGAAQFAMDGAVDRLRAAASARERAEGSAAPEAVVLAAADPANAYGAALPWPESPLGAGHKPGRKAGSLVVLVDGELTLYVERGGRTLLSWSLDPQAPALRAAADALAAAARSGALGTVTVERVNGAAALTSPLSQALEAAGFHATPRGLRLRA